ncbi:MAG: carbon-nitrogen hydrolase family protein [Bacteroidetes bacterium]|nr:carbon-nitrogen hydrolase family protein [Bacteroidota bacterium]
MPRIALIQQSASKDHAANLKKGIENAKIAIQNGAQILVFPELAFTRFFPQLPLKGNRMEHSEPIPGPTTNVFCDLAAKHNVVIVLNLYERDGAKAFDSSPVIDADGSIVGTTRMMHITQYESFYEQDYYDEGDTGAPVYDTAYGRIGVCICYDRHFPEYLRALTLQDAQLVVIPQAGASGEWPKGVFEAELQAGSFQNGYYMALSNRVGREEVLTFAGESFVTDPMGQIVAQAPADVDAILYADLDFDQVENSPARTLFMKHRRPGTYSDTVVGSREIGVIER